MNDCKIDRSLEGIKKRGIIRKQNAEINENAALAASQGMEECQTKYKY